MDDQLPLCTAVGTSFSKIVTMLFFPCHKASIVSIKSYPTQVYSKCFMFAISLCFLCAAVLKQMDFRSNQISVVAEVLISALKRYRKRFISSIMIRLPMQVNLDL